MLENNSLQTPLVTILINNYNYGRFLSAAIDSALSQTYTKTEVIVVDDGSTDNSCQIILSYGDRIQALFKSNGGQASAFNEGFKASKGKIICFLDADDIFEPDKVDNIVNIFRSHPDVNWCFHPLRYVETDTNIILRKYPAGLASAKIDFRADIARAKIPLFPPATSGLCFRSALLDDIMPMPEAITCISDNYLKYVALFLSPGYFIDKELATLRIHGNNIFTHRNDKQRLDAQMHMLIAFWIRAKFPILSDFSNKLFAIALSTYRQNGGIGFESQAVCREYFSESSFVDKIEIYLRSLYHSSSALAKFREIRLSRFKQRMGKGKIL